MLYTKKLANQYMTFAGHLIWPFTVYTAMERCCLILSFAPWRQMGLVASHLALICWHKGIPDIFSPAFLSSWVCVHIEYIL